MIARTGELMQVNGDEKPILKNPEGKAYKVSYIVAYVWEKLDGRTKKSKIVDDLCSKGNLEKDTLDSKIQWIIQELMRTGLAHENGLQN